jgi:sugar phosphate isomerase/epimerase
MGPRQLHLFPAPENPFPDGYRRIKALAPHVHVKDAVRPAGEEPRCVPIGDGEVDWPGQFKALREDGYSGYLSLETHWRATARLSNEALELPGGIEFSEGGEYASGICMNHIRSIFEQMGG